MVSNQGYLPYFACYFSSLRVKTLEFFTMKLLVRKKIWYDLPDTNKQPKDYSTGSSPTIENMI